MKRKLLTVFSLTTLILLTDTSCTNYGISKKKTTMNDNGFDIENLDKSVDPCDNFYRFAAGGWMEKNPIPDTESRWGSFSILFEENNEKLKGILEGLAEKSDYKKGSDEQLLSDYYATAMDSLKAEELGITPINEEMGKIKSIANYDDLEAIFAHHRKVGISSPFGYSVSSDSKNSNANISYVSQGGLSLPDKDYYSNTDERSKKIRAEFVDHLTKMFVLGGNDEATAANKAKVVMSLETRLAKPQMSRVDRRDPDLTYNKMTVADLDAAMPNFNWPRFFTNVGVSIDELVVSQPDYMKELDGIIRSVSIDDWKVYLEWKLLNSAASYLNNDFVKQDFYFYSTVLRGTKEMKPRWKRSLSSVNGSLGEPLGKMFVKDYFPEESKKKVSELVENLRAAYRDRIMGLEWMGDSTKEQALIKLEAFKYKIGYPDKWEDYSDMDISRDSYFQNVLNVRAWNFNDRISRLGKPVDKDEWFMSPQTVNAYYSSNYNEVVFPAGILQPPFYNPNADDAINYGAIGGVIGHEFTHGFDDKGSKSDAEGNLRDWWTKDDLSRFNERTQIVVDQFNAYEPIDSVFVNGELTLGENIADLGGLTLGYYAYLKSLDGKEPADIDGFTYKQRFFLGWAQVWQMNQNDEYTQNQVLTDPHSPGEYRVIGPLSNMKEFQEAFSCSDSDKMVRANKAIIW